MRSRMRARAAAAHIYRLAVAALFHFLNQREQRPRRRILLRRMVNFPRPCAIFRLPRHQPRRFGNNLRKNIHAHGKIRSSRPAPSRRAPRFRAPAPCDQTSRSFRSPTLTPSRASRSIFSGAVSGRRKFNRCVNAAKILRRHPFELRIVVHVAGAASRRIRIPAQAARSNAPFFRNRQSPDSSSQFS